jgi:hypothetical protein
MSLNSLRNFCRVLRISPKHSKISQYKGCVVFRGTQLCFWVALQIWSGNGEKLGQLQFLLFIGTLKNQNFAWRYCSNHLEKHRTTFVKVVEGHVIYNFAIYTTMHFYSNFWSLGQSNKVGRNVQGDVARAGAPESRRAPRPPDTRRSVVPRVPRCPGPPCRSRIPRAALLRTHAHPCTRPLAALPPCTPCVARRRAGPYSTPFMAAGHAGPPSSSLLCVAVPLPTPRAPYKSSRQDPARARTSSHLFRQLTRAPPHVISTPPPSCRIRSRPGPSYHPRVSPRTPLSLSLRTLPGHAASSPEFGW